MLSLSRLPPCVFRAALIKHAVVVDLLYVF